MFIGHIAVALTAKRFAPRTPLGVLVLAAQLPDAVWPVLVLAGLEKLEIHPGDTAFTPLNFVSYPWSHSLLLVIATGAVAGHFYRARTGDLRGGLAVMFLAISHWVLDWLSHRADLPLYPGGSLHGLGLWNSVPATLLVEGALFVAGIALYLQATPAKDRTGRYAFWSLIAFLTVIYVANLKGSPPPSDTAVAWVGIIGAVVLFAWAQWADRHRLPRERNQSSPSRPQRP